MKKDAGSAQESEDFMMSITVERAVNRTRTGNTFGTVVKRSENGLVSASFADELNRAAQTPAKTERSGGVDLKDVYNGLSENAKSVLDRMKPNVTKDEWNAVLQELRDAGALSSWDMMRCHPDIVIIGYTDPSGELVLYPRGDTCTITGETGPDGALLGNYWGIQDWSGDPFKYIDQWLKALQDWRDELDGLTRPNGVKYDTSALTGQIEAIHRVSGLMKRLLEMA